MNSIAASLIFLPAYQNQGTLKDYLDPLIANWTSSFIMTGLSDSLHSEIIKAGFDETELDDVVQVQADIKPSQYGFERQLLDEWTEWIMKNPERKEKVKEILTEYFFWKGKPFWEEESDEIPWYSEDEMPKTPEEALTWFKEIF